MDELSQRARVITGDIVWYLSGGLDDVERLEFALSSGGAVLKGRRGALAAKRLRNTGFAGRVWLDPTAYDTPTLDEQQILFGDFWLETQNDLAVVERISPGTYVPALDADALARGIDKEAEWVISAAGGRLSLALHARWLTDGLDQLIYTLQEFGGPVALAFADRNDPLSGAGAVAGLVEVIIKVPDVAVLRCDLGALGAAAHGAAVSAIGTSATVRHVVPPGQNAGGVPLDKSPSVFVQELLDFKLGSHLDEYPREATPGCDLACCRGGALRRFNDEHAVREARIHNRLAIRDAVDRVFAVAPAHRAAAFRSMCMQAEYAVEELAVKARRPLTVRPQVSAWARLG